MQVSENKDKKIYSGQVVSDKMDKTIVVKTSRLYKHPVFQKIIRTSKKVQSAR